MVQLKAESEYFQFTYRKIWIRISRCGLDTNKAPCRSPKHHPDHPRDPRAELGCSDCFIRALERVQTRAGSTGGDWSRLGTKPAILVGSWIARVGAELDRGRLVTRYLGRAGCLSTPMGVGIKRGAKRPVGFGAGVASGRIRGRRGNATVRWILTRRMLAAPRGPPVVTHLPATPWCHPYPQASSGVGKTSSIETSLDAVRAGTVSRSMNVSHGPNLVSSFVRLWATSDDV